MKQSINKIFIGLSFVFILALIPYFEINAQILAIPTDSTGGGGGGSGVTTPSMQVNLTADLDKSTYNPGDQMTVISSANWTVSGGGNTNVTVTGYIVDSTNSPTTILYLNTNSGNILYGSAVFNAPSVAGDYILRVDAGILGTTGRNAQTQKMATKDIPFTIKNNGATVVVWSLPSSGVKNDPVDVGSKTTIHWLASGLGQGATCSSPQNPNVVLNYPSGSFDTGVINSATNYTVTCKDKDGNTTTNTITPATQFVAKQGTEAVSVSPTPDLYYGDQVSDKNGIGWHLPFQTETDFKNVRQVATIILGSNNIKIETLNGFPHDVISAKKDDVLGKVWTVKEDGTYKIDISANGKMTVTIGNRGGFIAAANFYLIINGVKYPISADYGGDACSSTFKYPVQYSITNLKNCDPTIQDQHTSFGKEVPLDFNFTKTVALKAGDTVEIKGLVTGWGFNSSILRDLWQSVSFYLNTNYTNFTITKEAVTTADAAPANQISGTTTVAVKGPSMMVWSQPYVGPTAGIVNGKIKTNEQTYIWWRASGLSGSVYCISPDYVNQTDYTTPEPNTKLPYPSGNFRTEKLSINKEYTITCSDETTTTPPPTACTKDTKTCPDGSSVSRVAPSCDFATCPTATNLGYKYIIKNNALNLAYLYDVNNNIVSVTNLPVFIVGTTNNTQLISTDNLGKVITIKGLGGEFYYNIKSTIPGNFDGVKFIDANPPTTGR